ncbi:GvpL/GvpF family gas vesicle protein [Planosporangium mesophilum]|uniref:Gas vesicle protein n=1 Tax=Planosporangium mesophilum TaxID=689768 RepID=A0A8J3WYG0_9ACTN|nr:GvpL/GvpF family gas vesicle protein [Planosporangium mesophilum]NJC81813.1 GvpL/GvpF family gas vesicle protein [Planosporangium mesophilum]GII20526.1 gas vesicle protein [Planosporangium mesophilum]
MPVQVYGLVRAGHPDPRDLTGVGEPPAAVRLVRSGEVAAVVSDATATELHETDAVAYLDVLTALLRDGPVLPVRFGTVAPDEDAVREEILDPDAEFVAGRLDELDGLVELRVEVSADEEAEIRRVVADSPRLRDLVARARGNGQALDLRIGIGEEISHALDARRAEINDRIVDRLGPLAVSYGVRLSDDVTRSSHAFLVAAERLRDFDEALEQVRAELGEDYDLEYVGPIPAFDFIGGEIRPPSEAPAGRWSW